jgi:hypothetical protein
VGNQGVIDDMKLTHVRTSFRVDFDISIIQANGRFFKYFFEKSNNLRNQTLQNGQNVVK